MGEGGMFLSLFLSGRIKPLILKFCFDTIISLKTKRTVNKYQSMVISRFAFHSDIEQQF